jgi:hypothetical protein
MILDFNYANSQVPTQRKSCTEIFVPYLCSHNPTSIKINAKNGFEKTNASHQLISSPAIPIFRTPFNPKPFFSSQQDLHSTNPDRQGTSRYPHIARKIRKAIPQAMHHEN